MLSRIVIVTPVCAQLDLTCAHFDDSSDLRCEDGKILQKFSSTELWLAITLILSLILVLQALSIGWKASVPHDVQSKQLLLERLAKLRNGLSIWPKYQQHHPLASFTTLTTGKSKHLPAIQHAFKEESPADRQIRLERRGSTKTEFVKCWTSYRKHAWLLDELSPISGKGRNTFGGWAASLVDALVALWIINLKEEFDYAVNASMQIDFDTSSDERINAFETTVRYLGGFLGAYDLSGDDRLLVRALDVADMLMVACDTPNRLPITGWDWKAAAKGQIQEAPVR